jgi:hypothetical protein
MNPRQGLDAIQQHIGRGFAAAAKRTAGLDLAEGELLAGQRASQGGRKGAVVIDEADVNG